MAGKHRQARPAGVDTTPRARRAHEQNFPIVAIGLSSGGLEALSELMKALPAEPGFAIVLLSHMAPAHKSALVQVISAVCRMKVVEVRRATVVKPNMMYVMPAHRDLSVSRGTLRLIARTTHYHLPINRFFTDLAHDRGHRAIGVVLSGAGADGSDGMREIKAAGGINIAQDPVTARVDAMPKSAINTGCVDLVLAPVAIAEELLRICRHALLRADEPETVLPATSDDALQGILALLQSKTNIDYRDYKMSGVGRRIAKRMALMRIDTLPAYLEKLHSDAAEFTRLADEMLVHVTSFFRDADAFAALASEVIPAIISNAGEDGAIRIWVAGCASGEEAYSVAMLLLEQLGDRANRHKIQIFATDLSGAEIDRARSGTYPKTSIELLDPARVRRFFVTLNSHYQVTSALRETCVFTRHDLAVDPPFSNLDLICCRNVLIYLGSTLQKQVVAKFHYALKPAGYLFLGHAEPLTGYTQWFAARNIKQRIYQRKAGGASIRLDVSTPQAARGRSMLPVNLPSGPVFDLRREAERLLIDHYGPPGFVLDADLNILRYLGDTSRFLRPMPGEASFNLLTMITPGLVVALREAVREVREQGHAVTSTALEIEIDGRSASVDFELMPIRRDRDMAGFLLLLRTPSVAPAPRLTRDGEQSDAQAVGRLRDALVATQEHVREMLAEQEARTEELKVANEEILSSNEELQSTNEELETAKEELQATNEELTTVNEELATRNGELDRLTGDLSTLLSAIDVPVVLVDRERHIRRFTPSAERLFNLIPADIGRLIDNINPSIVVPDLPSIIDTTISQGSATYREVRDRHGCWYALRTHPYLAPSDRVDGALVALIDIDAVKRSSAAVVETIPLPLLVLDGELRIVSTNPAFRRIFALEEPDLENRRLFEVDNGAWDEPAIHRLFEETLPREHAFGEFRFERVFSRVGHKVLRLSGRRLLQDGVGTSDTLFVVEDVTEFETTSAALQEQSKFNERLIATAPVIVLVLDPGGRTQMINRYAEQLTGHTNGSVHDRDWFEQFVPVALRAGARARFKQELAGECAELTRERICTHNGAEIDVEWYSSPLLGSSGELTGVLRIGVDISERLQNEAELHRREQTLRGLSGRLITAQEDQNRRIARELHDVFGQRIAALALELSSLARLAHDDAESGRLRALIEETGSIASELHDVARQLHPRILDDLGLVAALRAECEKVEQHCGTPVQLRARRVPDNVPREVALTIYRIAQEALRNSGAHALASRITVSLASAGGWLKLRVRDNGNGFNRKAVAAHAGLGLANMEERASLLGGTFEVHSKPDGGTVVEVAVPLVLETRNRRKGRVAR